MVEAAVGSTWLVGSEFEHDTGRRTTETFNISTGYWPAPIGNTFEKTYLANWRFPPPPLGLAVGRKRRKWVKCLTWHFDTKRQWIWFFVVPPEIPISSVAQTPKASVKSAFHDIAALLTRVPSKAWLRVTRISSTLQNGPSGCVCAQRFDTLRQVRTRAPAGPDGRNCNGEHFVTL